MAEVISLTLYGRSESIRSSERVISLAGGYRIHAVGGKQVEELSGMVDNHVEWISG